VPDEYSPSQRQDDDTDLEIVSLLATSPGVLWEREDLIRELGSPLPTIDALRRLEATGIIHTIDRRFHVLTRTAQNLLELMEGP
jgi:uncharacterized membrane protein